MIHHLLIMVMLDTLIVTARSASLTSLPQIWLFIRFTQIYIRRHTFLKAWIVLLRPTALKLITWRS